MEEDIKILEEFIEECDKDLDSEICLKADGLTRKAIQHLIARNKELEEDNKTTAIMNSKLAKVNEQLRTENIELNNKLQMVKGSVAIGNLDVIEDYIPKSKVKEILKKLEGHNYKCNFDDVNFLQNIIIEIQELLGEED